MSRTRILGDITPLNTDTETGETGSGTDTRDFVTPRTHPKTPASRPSQIRTTGGKILGSGHYSSPKKKTPKKKSQKSPKKGVKFVDIPTDSGVTDDSGTDVPPPRRPSQASARGPSRSPIQKGSPRLRHSSGSSTRRGSTESKRSSKSTSKSSLPSGSKRPSAGVISSAYNVLTSRGVENQAPVEEGGENTGLTTTKRKSPKKPLDKNRRAVQIRNRAAKAYNQLANSGKVVKKKKSSSYENQKAFNQIFTASIGQLMEGNKSLTKKSTAEDKRTAEGKKPPKYTNHPIQDIDLIKNVPEPVRKIYDPHPLEDRDDRFFIDQFFNLYTHIRVWADTYFGDPNLNDPEWLELKLIDGSPWSQISEMKEFYEWADMVAEADPVVGGWDEMLLNGTSRKWLIAAVLIKIIKIKIFDEGLFGSNKQEKELMFAIERAMFEREGFQRQALRSKQARSIITTCPVTSEFYPDVATQTAQVFQLLKPIIDFLYGLPAKNGMELPPSTLLYQELHDIISDAAYLALCVRLSPTIFHWQELRPGEPFNLKEHTNVDSNSWKKSRNIQIQIHMNTTEEYKKQKNAALKEVQKYLDAGTIASAIGRQAVENREKLRASPPDIAANTFRAKAKIATWPLINRFKAGSYKDDGKDIPHWQKRGSREISIQSPLMLCYYDRVKADPGEFLEPKVPLSKYVSKLQQEGNEEKTARTVAKTLGIATTLGAAAVAGQKYSPKLVGAMGNVGALGGLAEKGTEMAANVVNFFTGGA